MTGARSCHRQRVAQNRAAKVRPVSEGLGEDVELGPEWAESRYSGGVTFRLGGQGVPRGRINPDFADGPLGRPNPDSVGPRERADVSHYGGWAAEGGRVGAEALECQSGPQGLGGLRHDIMRRGPSLSPAPSVSSSPAHR